MKCSDCKFWKTWECQGNPDAKDSDYAETFACFDLKEEYVSTTEAGRDDMNSAKEALKARNRALTTLIIGLLLIILAAFCGFLFLASGSGGIEVLQTTMTFFTIACIAALASVILFVCALMFFSQYKGLKKHIKNPVRKETDDL